MENKNEIIDALGGSAAVARLCEVAPAAVSQWKTNGIPRARMMYLRVIRPDVFVVNDQAVDAEGAE